MTDAHTCNEVRELIPELATGVAPGQERAMALAHIADCAECRAHLQSVAQTVDELMLLAPSAEPPAGFESRVLESIGNPTRRPKRIAVVAVAAAGLLVAGLAGVGLTRWADSADRELAEQHRGALAAADGESFRAAELTLTSGPAQGSPGGHVFAYEGQPSWLFMTVDGIPSQRYRVQLVTDTGESVHAGYCRVRNGYESWGTTVDVAMSTVERVEMNGRDGTALKADLT